MIRHALYNRESGELVIGLFDRDGRPQVGGTSAGRYATEALARDYAATRGIPGERFRAVGRFSGQRGGQA